VRVAIDTNVLVRLVTNDDAAQARAARDHLEGQQIYLAKSVLLEAEWVLRYS
jgi:predicted nucleic-acid-binding protein